MCDIVKKYIAEERAEAVDAMASIVGKFVKKTNKDAAKVMEDLAVPQKYRGEILKVLQNEK